MSTYNSMECTKQLVMHTINKRYNYTLCFSFIIINCVRKKCIHTVYFVKGSLKNV